MTFLYISSMPPSSPPVVLTIAGFDPASGAGITADIKTIAAHGCYGVACITALTVQSTAGVKRVEPVPAELIEATLEELADDLAISAVHIGMLGGGPAAEAVGAFLARRGLGNVVLDPIFRSSSGADLVDSSGRKSLVEKLIPLATVLTPNVDEAAFLTGLPVSNLEQMRTAASKLHSMGAAAVVVTGGHLEHPTDLLSFPGPREMEQQTFKSGKQRSRSTHGTGCAFSTAIACHLAQGRSLPEAVLLAKSYVSAAISHAYPLGRGIGPLHHLYRLHQKRRTVRHVEPETAH
jgi:hydroxymethylpyrimidine/phosphomethylpyrimidine kinase